MKIHTNDNVIYHTHEMKDTNAHCSKNTHISICVINTMVCI